MKNLVHALLAVSVAASNMQSQLDFVTKSMENLAEKIGLGAAEAVDFIEDGLEKVILGETETGNLAGEGDALAQLVSKSITSDVEHPPNTLVDTGSATKLISPVGWHRFFNAWSDKQVVPSFNESLYVGQWNWILTQPWAPAVSERYALHLALHATSGLDPPLIGMRFDITLPVLEQDALTFDRDHSFDKNCRKEDGSTVCRIDIGVKSGQDTEKFNDFAVLLPTTFNYDSITFAYAYSMHEWLGIYSQKESPQVVHDWSAALLENKATSTFILTSSFIEAATELPRLTQYRLILGQLEESTGTQFIKALSFTFSNGVETQDLQVYPSQMASSIQSTFNSATATGVSGKAVDFDSEFISKTNHVNEQIESVRFHKISINNEEPATLPQFEIGSGYEIETGFSDEVGVHEFICGVKAIVDSNHLYSARPVICTL